MTNYDDTNKGALFSERGRKSKDTDRDYSGTLNVEGKDYWLSAWIRTSKKTGQKFMSLSVKPKEEKTTGSGAVKRDMDDAIPFSPEWR
jgi:hypothetical protein